MAEVKARVDHADFHAACARRQVIVPANEPAAVATIGCAPSRRVQRYRTHVRRALQGGPMGLVEEVDKSRRLIEVVEREAMVWKLALQSLDNLRGIATRRQHDARQSG